MSHFFALLARMKFIRRWSLMHNTQEENIQEHTLQTAMIAYHLCLLSNLHFGGRADPKQAAGQTRSRRPCWLCIMTRRKSLREICRRR